MRSEFDKKMFKEWLAEEEKKFDDFASRYGLSSTVATFRMIHLRRVLNEEE